MDKWLADWLCSNLDDETLGSLRADVYDRWTWDTMASSDRELFDTLDEEAKKRKLAAPEIVSTLNFTGGPGIILTHHGSGDGGTITISVDENEVAKRVAELLKNDPSL